MMTPAKWQKALKEFAACLRKMNRQLDQIIALLKLQLEMMEAQQDEQPEDD